MDKDTLGHIKIMCPNVDKNILIYEKRERMRLKWTATEHAELMCPTWTRTHLSTINLKRAAENKIENRLQQVCPNVDADNNRHIYLF